MEKLQTLYAVISQLIQQMFFLSWLLFCITDIGAHNIHIHAMQE